VRIFSSVYIQCSKLIKKVHSIDIRQGCNRPEEGGYRAELSHALSAPICIKYDAVAEVLSRYLIEHTGLSIEEYEQLLLKRLLTEQKKYGDSIEYPIRAFTDASVLDQLNLKMDDKLCIVYNSREPVEDSVYIDIVCYIIIYKTLIDIADERTYSRIAGMPGRKSGLTLLVSVIITLLTWSIVTTGWAVYKEGTHSINPFIALSVVSIILCCYFLYKKIKN